MSEHVEQVEAERQFQQFSAEKTRAAGAARVTPLVAEQERSEGRDLARIGNDWTRAHYGGDFYLPHAPEGLPAVSLVFVQSRDGNTVSANPSDLGGGNTDLHLVYEGLSRVGADAVLAGAGTARGRVFFSVWRPELVALRDGLFLPRHPAQVVMSNDGNVDVDGTLLFNVPDVPSFILAGPKCRARWRDKFEERPWITLIPTDGKDLSAAFRALRERDITRISVVGGATTASALIDAGLVQDLVLTTTGKSAGTPNTPFYTGSRKLDLDLVASKRTAVGVDQGITVEQYLVNARPARRARPAVQEAVAAASA